MRKIFLDDKISDTVTIIGNEAHHLAYSLRAKKGDKIIAVDTQGNSAVIELEKFDKDKIYAKRIGAIQKVDSVERIKIFNSTDQSEKIFTKHITLAECLPKQNKFDYIVEKATELGVNKICPLISDRTIARPETLRAKTKIARWERVAKEAAEQCGRDTLPVCGKILELFDWLKEIAPTLGHFVEKDGKKIFDCKGSLLLFCHENEQQQTVQEILREYKQADCDKDIIILIGPEGGFAEREATEIKSVGGVSVSLGKRILKTDTAAISALAIVQYELN